MAFSLSDKNCALAADVFDHPDDIHELWKSFQAQAACGPHQTYEWIEVWLRCHPDAASLTPKILAIRDKTGACVAILPLAIRRRFGCRVLEWLGADQGNYSSGLFDRAFWSAEDAPEASAIVRLVLTCLPDVDIIHLADQPDTIGNFNNPLANLPGIMDASAGFSLPLSKDWEADYNARFSSSYRKNLRREERRLNDLGPLKFSQVDDPKARLETLRQLSAQKSVWCKAKGIPDFLADPQLLEFFKELVLLPAGSTGLEAIVLRLDCGDEMVASCFSLRLGNAYFNLLTSTTSGSHARFSPGKILNKYEVEHISGAGVEIMDCGAGEETNKLRWCTIRRERYHAILPQTGIGFLYGAVLKSVLFAKLRIKSSPALWQLTQRFRRLRGQPVGKRISHVARARS